MTAPNPLLLSTVTRFKPLRIRAHSRSPSRSPIRKAEFTAHGLDPLLANLSPEATLQAFSATEAPSTSGQKDQDGLRSSIANASTAERALGIKAALAAQKVQHWLAEISSWQWPNPKTSALGAGFLPPTGTDIGGQRTGFPEELPYMGSLRTDTVKQYEARIEEIKDGLEALDVGDLKEHVLDAHIPSRSRPGTSSGLAEVTVGGPEYGRLGDLTAVTTATILQTLPYLVELNMLISIWDVRIAVLFEVPELMQKLNTTRVAVEYALKEVRAARSSSLYTKPHVDSTKERLENEVASLGHRFDRALDLLEGREDSLPDSWIEEMDTIESDFGDWVVEAERRATNNQWRQRQVQPPDIPKNAPTTRDLADHSSEWVADPNISSTDSQAIAETAQNPIDEPRTSAKHDLLPEHPALVAFKHRPVRKASLNHSGCGADGHSADVLPGTPDAVDQEEKSTAALTTKEQTKPPAPSKDARGPDGNDAPEPTTPDIPVVSYSHQQQARLADLNLLHHVKSAKEYQPEFVGVDHGGAPASTVSTIVQAQPFSFLAQEPEATREISKKRPSPKLNLPPTRHRRGISEVSIADSAISEAFSDMSNAEIVDARTTQVLASPKISVVESPFRSSRDEDSSHANKERPRVQSMHLLGKDVPSVEPVVEAHKRSKSLTLAAISPQARAIDASHPLHKRPVDDHEVHDEEFPRPLMLHRASIASIEVIPKGLVRRLDSNRKSSYDHNPVSPIDSKGSPTDALKTLTSTGSVRSVPSAGTERTETPTPGDLSTRERVAGYKVQPSSYTEAGARSRVGTLDTVVSSSPTIPRSPSTRQSRDLDYAMSSADIERSSPSDTDDAPMSLPSTFSPFETKGHKSSSSSPNKSVQSEETLEAKIKDILINLPTRIRLTSDSASSTSPAHQSSSDSTRSSTPAPSITLSPARQDRSGRRYNAGNSEVKVYHLIRSGQPRDAPPTKLHVRLVGENGERVMVRVGGGWADLAEYLREYSLHHGKRTVQEGRLEVANLPPSGVKVTDTAGSSPVGPFSLNSAKTRSASRPDAGFDFGALPSLNVGKGRRSANTPMHAERKDSRSPSPAFVEAPPVRPPPVPVIPTSFREHPPKTTISPSTTKDGPTVTTQVRSRGPSLSASTFITPNRDSITTTHPTLTTSALSTPISTTSSPSYTPLGAAGPKGSIKNSKTRAATFGSPAVSSPDNEAWVQGMIGRARQVSAQNHSSITGPSNTKPTTSLSTPASRRVSAAADATSVSTPPSTKRSSLLDPPSAPTTPDRSRGTPTTSPSPAAKDANGTGSAEKVRSKSVTGIRRVFLRSSKKSDKVE